jgi:hypothetical protein
MTVAALAKARTPRPPLSPRRRGRPRRACLRLLTAAIALVAAVAAGEPHFARPVTEIERELEVEPLSIVSAAISRPRAVGDITLRVQASFAGRPPYAIKLRRAEPGAEAFNNRPRLDSAAYALQKLFLDPAEYVVPPTALRMIPIEELRAHSPGVRPTFAGSDDVLAVLQYWLQDVSAVADVYDPAWFAADAVYARHIGQLNVLTYLIEHADSNVGNFLIARSGDGARVFAVDNGTAFGFRDADRGELWRQLRVDRLPADTVERLRRLDEAQLRSRLAVLAQWELRDGHYVAVTPGANLGPRRGVRNRGGVLQLGLTSREIARVRMRARRILEEVDRGHIDTF